MWRRGYDVNVLQHEIAQFFLWGGVGTGADTIVFGSTAASNGNDIIANFELGAGKDILKFDDFFSGNSPSGVSAVVPESGSGAIAVANKSILRVTDDGAALTADEIVDLFGPGHAFAAPNASDKYVMVTSKGAIWYIDEGFAGSAGSLVATDIVQVGTLNGGVLALASLGSSNFGI